MVTCDKLNITVFMSVSNLVDPAANKHITYPLQSCNKTNEAACVNVLTALWMVYVVII